MNAKESIDDYYFLKYSDTSDNIYHNMEKVWIQVYIENLGLCYVVMIFLIKIFVNKSKIIKLNK